MTVKVDVGEIVEGLRHPRAGVVEVKLAKANTAKALQAAKTLEKAAAKTLPEAAALAATRETFHRDLGKKFRVLSGESATVK